LIFSTYKSKKQGGCLVVNASSSSKSKQRKEQREALALNKLHGMSTLPSTGPATAASIGDGEEEKKGQERGRQHR
jgi:hypothetical protein